ncbi:hypothetical protein [Achromobacter phage Motura]|uniref:Uncharacterized protein n=1 Tax=Achromobacter phage Motura TaxID=2591403 RepID=A0A514CST0_9CAUD|nr:hypothetical protein H1O15_gp286 [Achromobacter phage Motura]QDH83520.1 hypothetical protein [Achromobacter phage Motura]
MKRNLIIVHSDRETRTGKKVLAIVDCFEYTNNEYSMASRNTWELFVNDHDSLIKTDAWVRARNEEARTAAVVYARQLAEENGMVLWLDGGDDQHEYLD